MPSTIAPGLNDRWGTIMLGLVRPTELSLLSGETLQFDSLHDFVQHVMVGG